MDVILFTIILIIFIAILFNLQNYFENRKRDSLVDKIPGPTKLPFFGTLLPFLFTPRHKRFKVIIDLSNEYKKLGFFRMWIGSKIPEVRILRCDHAEQVFRSSKNIEKSRTYLLIEPWLGKGGCN
jgi:hypothetical protein